MMAKMTEMLHDISEQFDELISNIDNFIDKDGNKITGNDLKNIKNRDLTRPMATKLVWIYIKQEGLQNDSNKREIYCDDILQAMSGKKKIRMFDIGKMLSSHLFKQ